MDFSITKKIKIRKLDSIKKSVKKKDLGPYIGLDISPLGIHVVKCSKAENEISVIYKGGMSFLDKINISNIDEMKYILMDKRLQNCFVKTNSEDNLTNVSLMVPNINWIFKTLPFVDKKGLDKIIEIEAKKEQIDVDKNIIDYLVLQEIEEKRKKFFIGLVSFPKDNIYQLLDLLNKIQLEPYCIETIPLSLVRLLKFNGDINSDFNSIIIYIGADAVSASLLRGELFCMHRCFLSVGEFAIINAISENMNIDFTEAHKIKKHFVLAKDSESYSSKHKKILEIVRKILDRRIVEIERSIQFFMNEYPPSNIEKIFLAGNDLIKGMDVYLSEKINLPVEIINPFKKIKLNDDIKKDEESFYSYAVATGLAIRDLV